MLLAWLKGALWSCLHPKVRHKRHYMTCKHKGLRFMAWVNSTYVSGIKVNVHPSITFSKILFLQHYFNVKSLRVWVVSPSHNPLVEGKHLFSTCFEHIFAFQGVLLRAQKFFRIVCCVWVSLLCKNQSVHLHSCSHLRIMCRSGWNGLCFSLRAMVFHCSGFHSCG